jgi:Zn-dependent protease
VGIAIGMESSLTLGRIAGIRVGINWTWLFVFALLVWSLGGTVFPHEDKGLSHGAYWGMAAVAALAFFCSILLHELGHALQARREGIEIEGITLWLFGGVARFRGAFPAAGAEFRIAVAGPLVTLVIGAVLLAIELGTSLPKAVSGVVAWLAYINFFLLVFNLLPALPLDGGRILHSALWAAKHDLVWATRVGTGIGRGIGYLMIAAGIATFIGGAGVGGLWLAFIGWFLNVAASAEAQQLLAREALRGVRVRDLMVRDPVTVTPETTIEEFVDRVAWEHRHPTYPVVENSHPLGLVLFRYVAEIPREQWSERTVRDCMVPVEQVPRVREQDAAADALPKLAAAPGRALVLDHDHLEGLISISDIARALAGRGELGRALASGLEGDGGQARRPAARR